jgi:hypothetical protein
MSAMGRFRPVRYGWKADIPPHPYIGDYMGYEFADWPS